MSEDPRELSKILEEDIKPSTRCEVKLESILFTIQGVTLTPSRLCVIATVPCLLSVTVL